MKIIKAFLLLILSLVLIFAALSSLLSLIGVDFLTRIILIIIVSVAVVLVGLKWLAKP